MSGRSPSERRDRQATEERLIQAVLDIVRDEGYAEVGVNSVARRAGVGKMLIYRYFGDFGGLLRAAANRIDPLQSKAAEALVALTSPEMSAGDVMSLVVRKLHEELEGDAMSKNLMAWELSHGNELTEALAEAREEVGLRLTGEFRELLMHRRVPPSLDVHALFTIVTAAVSYLTLRSESVQEYNGIDIRSSEGWARIAATVKTLVDGVAESGG